MSSGSEARPRRVILLGSTGSIGVSALEVIEHLMENSPLAFEVVGLATGSHANVLAEQARRFGASHAAVADPSQAEALGGIEHVYIGPDAATQLVAGAARPGDLVVAAIVGSAGLGPVLAAIERGCDIALANKETLVAAGNLVIPAARATGAAPRRSSASSSPRPAGRFAAGRNRSSPGQPSSRLSIIPPGTWGRRSPSTRPR